MDEIQRHIIKRGKRNPISRRYRKKKDKETITTWKSDLNGVLHVFDVCSVTSVWRSLTFRFQVELRIDAHPAVSDTRQDAADKHTVVSDVHPSSSNIEVVVPDVHCDVSNINPIVSGVRSDVENTRTVVSDIHCNKLKSPEGVDGRNQAVSTTRTLRHRITDSYYCLDSRQVSDLGCRDPCF
jgi:hypothetical protein